MPPPDGGPFLGGGPRAAFYRIITEAVRDIEAHGYDSQARLDRWMERIRQAAQDALVPLSELTAHLRTTLGTIYQRMIERGGILRLHPGMPRFTLQRVAPQLRAELDRRILASAGLIKLNRQASIEKTLQRFAGWTTSVPAGGSEAVDKGEVKADVRKALAQLPFEERRVLIDQGHKLVSSLSTVIAKDGGAIAMVWHSHWRQTGYHYRPDHKDRDDKVYALRGSWALDRGLMTKGAGYTDEMTAPAEEPMCRCNAQWLYALRALPDEMLTAAGRAELERVRAAQAA